MSIIGKLGGSRVILPVRADQADPGGVVMAEVPFELRYALSRRQRLLPLLRVWGVAYPLFVLALFGFFCERTITSVLAWSWAGLAVFGGLGFWLLLLHGGLFGGLLDVIFVPVRSMDLRVEENGLGFLIGGERWWIFLDGLTSVEPLTAGVWTVQHCNGTVILIPADVISEAQIAHLRKAMQRGRTKKGVAAVIERGRRMEELGE
jgi:hypothetical protein